MVNQPRRVQRQREEPSQWEPPPKKGFWLMVLTAVTIAALSNATPPWWISWFVDWVRAHVRITLS